MRKTNEEDIAVTIAKIDRRIAGYRKVLAVAGKKYDLYAVQGTWLKRLGFVITEGDDYDDWDEEEAKRALWNARCHIDCCVINRAYLLDKAGLLLPEEELEAQDAFNRVSHGADETWRDLAAFAVEGQFHVEPEDRVIVPETEVEDRRKAVSR